MRNIVFTRGFKILVHCEAHFLCKDLLLVTISYSFMIRRDLITIHFMLAESLLLVSWNHFCIYSKHYLAWLGSPLVFTAAHQSQAYGKLQSEIWCIILRLYWSLAFRRALWFHAENFSFDQSKEISWFLIHLLNDIRIIDTCFLPFIILHL